MFSWCEWGIRLLSQSQLPDYFCHSIETALLYYYFHYYYNLNIEQIVLLHILLLILPLTI